MNRFTLISLMILMATSLLLTPLYADNIDKNAGTKGFLFLQIPSSPELAGMANTGDAQHTSPVNMLHHPAAFDWQRGSSVAFTHTMWLVDTYLYNIAYRNVRFSDAFGVALKYMDYGKIDERDDRGTLLGNYYPMDLQLGANYVRKITPDITAGVNLNLIYQKIDTSSAYGVSADFGAMYLTPLRNTSIDLALRNIGGTSKMDIEKIDLPFTTEMGVSTGFDLNEQLVLYPALKVTYMNDHDDILPAMGVNFKIYQMLFLRAGYKFNYNEEDFSAGLGVHYKNFQIDYAFINNNIEGIDTVHKFGVTYKF